MRFLNFDHVTEEDKGKINEDGSLSIPNDTVKQIIDLACAQGDFNMITGDQDIDFEAYGITRGQFYDFLNTEVEQLNKITGIVEISEESNNNQGNPKIIYSQFNSDRQLRMSIGKGRIEGTIEKGLLDDKIDELENKLNGEEMSPDSPKTMVALVDFLIETIQLTSKYETQDGEAFSPKLSDRMDWIIGDLLGHMPPTERRDFKEEFQSVSIDDKYGEGDNKKVYGFILCTAYDKYNSGSLALLSKYRDYFSGILDQEKIDDLKRGLKSSEGSKNSTILDGIDIKNPMMSLSVQMISIKDVSKNIPEGGNYSVYVNDECVGEGQTSDSVDLPFVNGIPDDTKIKIHFLDAQGNIDMIDECVIDDNLPMLQ